MLQDNARLSNDIIRWLKLLALPRWAKVGLAIILLFTLANALGLLAVGMLTLDKDSITAGITVMTVGLPVGLMVVAVVFGDGGLRRLKSLTQTVLNEDIPTALRENFNARPFEPAGWLPKLQTRTSGCCADYRVRHPTPGAGVDILHFIVELNINKVNLVILLPHACDLAHAADYFRCSSSLQSCLDGALREGYALNEAPEHRNGATGLVLTRTLHEDFLLDPARRLYFAQDLAFFIRGMIEAHRG
ncbi:hypothetical protein Tther_00172 [Tepidimonas thermarum]|uniref:Uncharacterized protein n=1 Tax=Tepidimonas thermarum TaxID=335431 RepID=A0A554X828_9BURK|nr:hypothetical protein [Tepidimonas thermarum]TSE31970.1 hypothetical protein Tther_00172 [Tepidimonas thermarum]